MKRPIFKISKQPRPKTKIKRKKMQYFKPQQKSKPKEASKEHNGKSLLCFLNEDKETNVTLSLLSEEDTVSFDEFKSEIDYKSLNELLISNNF